MFLSSKPIDFRHVLFALRIAILLQACGKYMLPTDYGKSKYSALRQSIYDNLALC